MIMDEENTRLYLIIPCYNEEAIINITADRVNTKFNELIQNGLISMDSRIVFVDDGSMDNTWGLIQQYCYSSSRYIGVKLSRNFGQQNALLAGMEYARGKCDCIISIDADLQDDINVLSEFIEKYRHGHEIVYGVRDDRSTDSMFKRYSASLFYKIMKMIDSSVIENHSECRLLGSKALEALSQCKEYSVFLRGIIPRLGFNSEKVYYSRQKRIAGETKYSVWKLIKLALEGIILSDAKLNRYIHVMTLACLIFGLFNVRFNPWIGLAIQLSCLSIFSGYVAKIYTETKQRPRYIIDCIAENKRCS